MKRFEIKSQTTQFCHSDFFQTHYNPYYFIFVFHKCVALHYKHNFCSIWCVDGSLVAQILLIETEFI